MAHEVEQMAYANEVPWHGLGSNIKANATIEEWQTAAGLDWEVKKAPVMYRTEAYHVFKDRFVLYRNTDSTPMGVAAGRYKIVQPKELLEFYRDLIGMYGMTIETAGSLRHGKRIWALAKTGNVHEVLGKDKVEGYLLLATSYDSTFSTLAQFTTVRVVCNNTLSLAFKDKAARVTIPHVQEFDPDAVKEQMGIGKEAWEAFQQTSDILARTKVDDDIAKQFIRNLFDVDKLQQAAKLPELAVAESHANNVNGIYLSDAPQSKLAGKTAWGLVNAVTSYVDHSKRARGSEGRLNSAWFGDGAQLKQEAWDRAKELVMVTV